MTWSQRLLRAASLRHFLLAWLLGGLWLTVALITLWHGVATFVQVAQAQDERLGVALSQVVQAAAQGEGLASAPPIAEPLSYRVSTMKGEWLAGDRALAAYPWRSALPDSGLPRLYITQWGRAPMRAAAALRHVPGSAAGEGVVVQVVEPLRERVALWQELPKTLLGWVYGAAAAMTLVIWSGVAMASRWLERARQALDSPQVDAAAYDGPAELRPAVERMHGLHRRQREWVGQQRRFLADASHQLRTPMSVLRTQLQSAIAGDVPASEVLPQMLHTVDRATGMANQLLSLTKLEQIKRAGELKPVELRAVARDAVMELAPLIAAKRLDFALEGEALWAPADALMLGELLRNLLANAIHHTPPAGRLGVLLRAYARTTELVVWDEGQGLDDALRPRLFQAFTAAKGGVGLGLSICRQIADAMGATMELYNRVEDGRVIGVDAVVTWGQGP
ncbi:HAMP domain-containing histidine kinase [Variovorax paradoxus]|nr:HAMP domain-containing sensor histidine kinase [Variovorax paradoxus]MBT2300169.1 HAMP domain-containing histidine kinase [Variovorax paradoxus]